MEHVDTDLWERIGGVECLRWNPRRVPRGAPEGFTQSVANFGDLLGPIIIRRVRSGRDASPGDGAGRRRLLSIGSVLHFASDDDVIWGSGLNGKVGAPTRISQLDVRATRGPLTRAFLLAHDRPVPTTMGDPALLLCRLWPELATPLDPVHPLTVVPNLNDEYLWSAESQGLPGSLVAPTLDPWSMIDRIRRSAFVTGSSLHALIVADALGVPSRPLAPRSEHPFKYLDHYAGTGRPGVEFARDAAHALELGPVPPARVDAEALLEAFPDDLWDGSGHASFAPPGDRDARWAEGRRIVDELAEFEAIPEVSRSLARLTELMWLHEEPSGSATRAAEDPAKPTSDR